MKYKIIKKLILILILFVILSNYVNADAFATIAQTGLTFVNPTAATIVNGILCVTGPAGLVTCATNYVQGKIVGQVTGEVLQQIAKVSPETYNAIATYNKIKGYIDQGSQIIEELELDENGKIKKGKIDAKGTTLQLGTDFGFEKDEDALLQNCVPKFRREEGYNLVTFKENGKFWVKQNGITTPFENIKAQDDKINAYIKLDTKGNIIEADITSNKEFEYTFKTSFGLRNIFVPPNTKITYGNGEIKVYGNNERNFFDLSKYLENSQTRVYVVDIGISKGESITIIGDKIIGKKFSVFGAQFNGLNGNNAEATFSTNNQVISIGKRTNANIKEVEHLTFDNGLNLYYDENFDSTLHKNENYFNYKKFGYEMGGSGFSSKPDSYARLIFEMNGGKVSINSYEIKDNNLYKMPINQLLYLKQLNSKIKLKGEGNFNLYNGNWIISSKDNKIYTSIQEDKASEWIINMDFTLKKGEKMIVTPIPSTFITPSTEYKFELEKKLDGNVYSESIKSNDHKDINLIITGPSSRELEGFLNIEFKRPIHTYKGKEYLSGGDLKGPLDLKFYDKFIKEAIEYNIDPYWASATTIVEYAGIRGGFYYNLNRYGAYSYGYIPVDNTAIADFNDLSYRNKLDKNFIKNGLDPKKLILKPPKGRSTSGPRFTYGGSAKGISTEGALIEEFNNPLHIISFTNGQIRQNRILYYYNQGLKKGYDKDKAISYGLQNYMGYGLLNGEDKYRYPPIKGSEFPVYGEDVREFMLTLYKNPTFRSLVNKYNPKTPIMNEVLKGETSSPLASK